MTTIFVNLENGIVDFVSSNDAPKDVTNVVVRNHDTEDCCQYCGAMRPSITQYAYHSPGDWREAFVSHECPNCEELHFGDLDETSFVHDGIIYRKIQEVHLPQGPMNARVWGSKTLAFFDDDEIVEEG